MQGAGCWVLGAGWAVEPAARAPTRVYGLRLAVLNFNVQGLSSRVQGEECKVWGAGCGVDSRACSTRTTGSCSTSGLRAQGSGFKL